MAKVRKDNRGWVLKPGEVQRKSDNRYLYAAGKATINDTFDRYIKMKSNLRDSMHSEQLYLHV